MELNASNVTVGNFGKADLTAEAITDLDIRCQVKAVSQ